MVNSEHFIDYITFDFTPHILLQCSHMSCCIMFHYGIFYVFNLFHVYDKKFIVIFNQKYVYDKIMYTHHKTWVIFVFH